MACMWLPHVRPALTRMSDNKRLAILGLLPFLGFAAYAVWPVECPFCHAGHVDAQGRCRLGNQCRNFYPHPDWAQMSEKERSKWTGDPGHWKAATCPWCGHTGIASRMTVGHHWSGVPEPMVSQQ